MENYKIIFDSSKIDLRIKELGAIITKDYATSDSLVAVCLLKGAVIFYSDLVRNIKRPLQMGFIDCKSYGDGTSSSGNVKIVQDLDIDINGKDVLLIDDICDSGNTMKCLKDTLLARNPRSLKVCCLLNKASRRTCDIIPEYVGFEIPDIFVYGFGLDDKQNSRNLPYIAYKVD